MAHSSLRPRRRFEGPGAGACCACRFPFLRASLVPAPSANLCCQSMSPSVRADYGALKDGQIGLGAWLSPRDWRPLVDFTVARGALPASCAEARVEAVQSLVNCERAVLQSTLAIGKRGALAQFGRATDS